MIDPNLVPGQGTTNIVEPIHIKKQEIKHVDILFLFSSRMKFLNNTHYLCNSKQFTNHVTDHVSLIILTITYNVGSDSNDGFVFSGWGL